MRFGIVHPQQRMVDENHLVPPTELSSSEGRRRLPMSTYRHLDRSARKCPPFSSSKMGPVEVVTPKSTGNTLIGCRPPSSTPGFLGSLRTTSSTPQLRGDDN
jgi:hypothetical protein